jgi:hypothetical protein
MQELYIIEYDNAHWCGGTLHCVVWAEDETEAEDLASGFMEESQRELYSDHYDVSDEYDNESAFSVTSVQLLQGSEYEEFYADPVQRANFYPLVNQQ